MFNSKLNDRVMHFVKQVNLEKDLAKFPAGVDYEKANHSFSSSGSPLGLATTTTNPVYAKTTNKKVTRTIKVYKPGKYTKVN